MIQQDPSSTFARYGLAMEYLAQGNTDAALAAFATCIEHNPDYVPAFQRSAQTLAKLGRNAEALDRIEAGLAAATCTGNQHAHAELTAMQEELKHGAA